MLSDGALQRILVAVAVRECNSALKRMLTCTPMALMPSEVSASTAESRTGWRRPVIATAAPCNPAQGALSLRC